MRSSSETNLTIIAYILKELVSLKMHNTGKVECTGKTSGLLRIVGLGMSWY